MECNSERKLVSAPVLTRQFNGLLTKVSQLPVQGCDLDRILFVRLLDARKLDLRRAIEITLCFPSDAAQRKRRNRPEQAEGMLHGSVQVHFLF